VEEDEQILVVKLIEVVPVQVQLQELIIEKLKVDVKVVVVMQFF